STFALTLLDSDGQTPLQTTAADGAVLRITLSPDGGTHFVTTRGSPVSAVAVNAIAVADAPLQAVLVPIQAVEGTPFAGTVAAFTDGNPLALTPEFTASIPWGDGTAAT